MKLQKIYDTSVRCYCNRHKQDIDDVLSCRGGCRCYCHQPKWLVKLAWFLQGIPKDKGNKEVGA